MWPFHLRLGPFALGVSEIFVLLGYACVALLARKRLAEVGIAGTALLDLGLATLVGGAVGAKMYYLLPTWIGGGDIRHLVAEWGAGSGYYGGFVGASLAAALLFRLKRRPVRRAMDAGASALPAGFAVGKIGCFLAGCCYGRPCAGFPGVRFAPGSLASQTQSAPEPVHPVQLYDAAFALLLLAGLAWVLRRSRRPGETYLAYVAGYSCWRFAIEFLRDDPGRHTFGAAGISDSQIAALVLLALTVPAWILLRRTAPSGAATPSAGAPPEAPR